ncbi:MAG: tRNA epoxyqueuosine(34) reductase QueG [Firmicutes bacterium]|nr:tRNA epoxyqueuosine(34) reductase QueG [Bacillota bacterium]MDD4693200.1 tRNA epoxyqueuosine(34) reductase QueG [Bacillota bacterium]
MSNWVTFAEELGFLEPKSCSIDALDSFTKNLENRAAYLDPHILRNFNDYRFPQKRFPHAKSVISLALPYYHKPTYSNMGDFSPFSIYCQGKDYHLIFKSLLKEYLMKLKRVYPSYFFEGFSDTGPILDRAAATASGLGYLGYNTCVIHPKYGSFVFLGTVLTDLPLDEEEFLGPCKRCKACIKACPTGAIREPYLLDNNICISALTQTKGFLNLKQMEMIKGHIFGCDICQLVCPHNKNLPSSSMITPFYKLQDPPLMSLVYPDAETKRLIKQSAAGWRGITTIRRNALIAIAFSEADLNLEILKKVAREDSSHLIRAYSAFCIQKRTGDKSLWTEILSASSSLESLTEFYISVKDSC